ncbi:hypothetical protein [uncultured Amnibacterium sp.]|uniref:hypothetical protein n=1 Tax=uncultured Amnibacterium sp. TaxID=1631851 RepID=UPI0035CCA31F
MAVLIRTWLGLAVLGAGMVHLGVAATAPPALLAIFTLFGLGELAWGVAALAGRTLPLPRLGLVIVLLPPVTWITVALVSGAMAHGEAGGPIAGSVVGTVLGPGHGAVHVASGMSLLPGLPLLLASVLDLIPAIVIAVRLRRGPMAPEGVDGTPSALPYLLGVVAGGGLVAAVTSTALGGTELGALGMQGMGH